MGTPTAHAEAAYHPRQGACSISRDHAVLDQPLTVGQFRRAKGDALCKPARKFWGLAPGGSRAVDCPECIARAGRYGVTLLEVNPYETQREQPPAMPEPQPVTPGQGGGIIQTLAQWMQED